MVTWQLTIDCAEPGRMVRFWAPLLGYAVTPPPEGHATWNDYYRSVGVPEDELDADGDGSDRIHDPEGEGPTIWFQPVPEPKAGKNRLHLDIYLGPRRQPLTSERVAAIDAKVDELVAAGGTVVRRTPEDVHPSTDARYSVLMQDPEGNEFCVA